MKKPTMQSADLFEIEKVQVFDMLTGNYICTMSLHDSTGDTRSISEYTPKVDLKEYDNPKQTKLF